MSLDAQLPNVDVRADDPDDAAQAEAFAEAESGRLYALTAYGFRALHLAPTVELSITLVGEAEMERLHLEWMDLAGPTDVMSFPMDELRPGTEQCPAEGTLGDIVLCPSVAQRQAQAHGHTTSDELCLLTVHGILHCLGYDHGTPEEEREMFGLQRRILEGFLGRTAPVETRN